MHSAKKTSLLLIFYWSLRVWTEKPKLFLNFYLWVGESCHEDRYRPTVFTNINGQENVRCKTFPPRWVMISIFSQFLPIPKAPTSSPSYDDGVRLLRVFRFPSYRCRPSNNLFVPCSMFAISGQHQVTGINFHLAVWGGKFSLRSSFASSLASALTNDNVDFYSISENIILLILLKSWWEISFVRVSVNMDASGAIYNLVWFIRLVP